MTPVLTGPSPTLSAPSPRTSVTCPTVTPETSVIALSGPGVPSNGTPRSRARGLSAARPAAARESRASRGEDRSFHARESTRAGGFVPARGGAERAAGARGTQDAMLRAGLILCPRRGGGRAADEPAPGKARPRKVAERIVCRDRPAQAYALYLPSSYATDRPAPILYLLDARGRALVALERFREAAEAYGWILASSYGSRSDTKDDPNTPGAPGGLERHARALLDRSETLLPRRLVGNGAFRRRRRVRAPRRCLAEAFAEDPGRRPRPRDPGGGGAFGRARDSGPEAPRRSPDLPEERLSAERLLANLRVETLVLPAGGSARPRRCRARATPAVRWRPRSIRTTPGSTTTSPAPMPAPGRPGAPGASSSAPSRRDSAASICSTRTPTSRASAPTRNSRSGSASLRARSAAAATPTPARTPTP